jgi:hypothetical protein
LTNVERGENVTAVACINAAGTYVPPVIIFKGIRKSPQFQDGLPPGSVVGMSYSGWINEDLFQDWLKYFLKFESEGKVLLILDKHGIHTSYEAIRFCKDHSIKLIGLSPHSTRVLQPLDRTFLKSLKAQYHKNATEWMHRNPTEAINKVRFSSLFAEVYNKTATVGAAVKCFMCSGICPCKKTSFLMKGMLRVLCINCMPMNRIHLCTGHR